MYAMMCTWLDICYAMGFVSRYQSYLRLDHWKMIKSILRYLNGTVDYALCYRGSYLRVVGFTHTDWGGDLDDLKLTSGYTFFINHGAIFWSSKK